MIAQERFDFTHVPDEELYNPARVFWQGKEAENAAWKAEMERRKEAKRLEQERIAKEGAARLHAIKNVIPYSEALATEICSQRTPALAEKAAAHFVACHHADNQAAAA